MNEFYNVYSSLFVRFYRALEKKFLYEALLSEGGWEWDKPKPIGYTYFVKMVEDSIVLIDYRDENNITEYPGFFGVPFRDLVVKLDTRWLIQLQDCVYAMKTKIIPAFWNDFCVHILPLHKNLDILGLSTPKGMTHVTYQDGHILVHVAGDEQPYIYSITRFNELEILRRIKSLIGV